MTSCIDGDSRIMFMKFLYFTPDWWYIHQAYAIATRSGYWSIWESTGEDTSNKQCLVIEQWCMIVCFVVV